MENLKNVEEGQFLHLRTTTKKIPKKKKKRIAKHIIMNDMTFAIARAIYYTVFMVFEFCQAYNMKIMEYIHFHVILFSLPLKQGRSLTLGFQIRLGLLISIRVGMF